MSHAGTTCWGRRGTGKLPMIWNVAGSMTSTVFDSLFGT